MKNIYHILLGDISESFFLIIRLPGKLKIYKYMKLKKIA